MKKLISIVILTAFISTAVQLQAFAQVLDVDPMPYMPVAGTMVQLSPEFTPAYLKGIVIHPENALKFDFIIYKGDQPLTDFEKRQEYTKLTKYFLASLAIPDDDQWVNLSPYEKDRIIKDDFGKTEMGRDLLAQDYMLKQITASLIYPEDKLGKEFWAKIYARAQEKFGTTNIPVNTFNKVWILPDDALIYEKGDTAYVLKNHLRVMLEEDYLSLQHHAAITSAPDSNASPESINSLGSQIVREIVLPELQREVNQDQNFATVRQVYSGMLLATWYKRALKESLLSRIYADQAKVKGVDQDPKNNEEIYRQYLRAYKKGVFNFIQEDVDKYTNEVIPRKYFSGGAVNFAQAARDLNVDTVVHTTSALNPDQAQTVQGEVSDIDLAQIVTEEKPVADAAQQAVALAPAVTVPAPETNIELANIKTNVQALNENGFDQNAWTAAYGEFNTNGLGGVKSKYGNNTPLINIFQIISTLPKEQDTLSGLVREMLPVPNRNEPSNSPDAAMTNKPALVNFADDYARKGNLFLSVQDAKAFNYAKDLLGILDRQIRNPTNSVHFVDPQQTLDVFDSMALKADLVPDLDAAIKEEIDDMGYPQEGLFENVKELLTAYQKPFYEGHDRNNTKNFFYEIAGDYYKKYPEVIEGALAGNGQVTQPDYAMSNVDRFALANKLEGVDLGAMFQKLPVIEPKGIKSENLQRVALILGGDIVRDDAHPTPRLVWAEKLSHVLAAVLPNIEVIRDSWSLPESGVTFRNIGVAITKDEINRSNLTLARQSEILKEVKSALASSANLLLVVNHSPRVDNAMRAQLPMPNRSTAAAVPNANPLGGIDFNSANLDLQIKRDGNGVPLPLSQQDLDNIHIDGLVPIIIDIKPANGLPLFTQLQNAAPASNS